MATIARNLTQDLVNSPDHYTFGRKYEPKDVIRDWGLNYNLGCVVKYISRAGRKDDILLDLYKARKYLEFEIEAIAKEREPEEDLSWTCDCDDMTIKADQINSGKLVMTDLEKFLGGRVVARDAASDGVTIKAEGKAIEHDAT